MAKVGWAAALCQAHGHRAALCLANGHLAGRVPGKRPSRAAALAERMANGHITGDGSEVVCNVNAELAIAQPRIAKDFLLHTACCRDPQVAAICGVRVSRGGESAWTQRTLAYETPSPSGVSGISVVRLSGGDRRAICTNCVKRFRAVGGWVGLPSSAVSSTP